MPLTAEQLEEESVARIPYFLANQCIPRDPVENVRFRKWIRHWVGMDLERQQLVRSACGHDPIFWIETFGWVHEPRGRQVRKRPLILWPHQREFLQEMYERRGERDLGAKKSRAQGITWGIEHIIYHCTEFEDDVIIMMLSRNKDMVDKKGSQDSLFWKLRWIREQQPPYLRSPWYDVDMLAKNLLNGNTVLGGVSSEDAGRGGRHFFDFPDELSAWGVRASHELMGSLDLTSDCMFPVGTPKGIGGAFDERIMVDKPKMDVMTLPWTRNPSQTVGLYRKRNGRVEYLDREFWSTVKVGWVRKRYDYVKFADGVSSHDPAVYHYPFVEEPNPPWDGLRSPWYDHMVNKLDNPILRARELDIQREKSGDIIFDVEKLKKCIQDHPKDPYHVGMLKFDASYFGIMSQRRLHYGTGDDMAGDVPTFAMPKWDEAEIGEWSLWFHLDERGRPPSARTYIIAADVSFGTGASNAALAVVDVERRRKVARFKSATTDATELAQITFAAAIWFGSANDLEAMVIFEKQGPGITFGKNMIEYGHSHFYRSRTDRSLAEDIGWPSSREGKAHLFREYRAALFKGYYANPDVEALEELRQYHWQQDKSHNSQVVIFVPMQTGMMLIEGSKGRPTAPHGDLAITDILAWHALKGVPPKDTPRDERADYVTGQGDFQPHTPGWRRQQYLRKHRAGRNDNDMWN
jgi:hypothetical protein